MWTCEGWLFNLKRIITKRRRIRNRERRFVGSANFSTFPETIPMPIADSSGRKVLQAGLTRLPRVADEVLVHLVDVSVVLGLLGEEHEAKVTSFAVRSVFLSRSGRDRGSNDRFRRGWSNTPTTVVPNLVLVQSNPKLTWIWRKISLINEQFHYYTYLNLRLKNNNKFWTWFSMINRTRL